MSRHRGDLALNLADFIGYKTLYLGTDLMPRPALDRASFLAIAVIFVLFLVLLVRLVTGNKCVGEG